MSTFQYENPKLKTSVIAYERIVLITISPKQALKLFASMLLHRTTSIHNLTPTLSKLTNSLSTHFFPLF